MQPKQFKIALECLYNGCMPFVLNPNKDLKDPLYLPERFMDSRKIYLIQNPVGIMDPF